MRNRFVNKIKFRNKIYLVICKLISRIILGDLKNVMKQFTVYKLDANIDSIKIVN